MSDIFISYAKGDRPKVEPLAKALEEHGWSVWWDRKIPPGKTFAQVIQEAINAAKCMIVIWSNESVKSEWVIEEATIGNSRGILVPARVDSIDPPLGFGRIQAADLTDWNTGTSNLGFTALLDSIKEVVELSGKKDNVNFSELTDQNESIKPEPIDLSSVEKESIIIGQPKTRIELISLTVSLASLIAVIVLITIFSEFDNYLLAYILFVPAMVIIIWVVLKFTDSDIQVLAIKLVFLLFGFLATIAVIWRGTEKIETCPHGNIQYYIPLIAIMILICVLNIFLYTRDHSKRANRLPIYTYFIFFCMYLGICRLVWQILDKECLTKTIP